MSYIYDLTDTWNAAGTVFTAIKMNVTNSASATGSKLIDLQLAGTTFFNVDKSGNVGINTATPSAKLDISGSNNILRLKATSGSAIIVMDTSGTTDSSYVNFGTNGVTDKGYVHFGGATNPFLGGANALSVWNAISGPVAFGTNNVERMRISAAGNVGIGTGSPLYKLDVSGSTNTIVQQWSGAGSSFNLQMKAVDGSVSSGLTYRLALDFAGGLFTNGFIDFYRGGDGATGFLAFGTSGTERMRIDATGNVGIGTTTPSNKLVVVGGQINTVADDAYGVALNATTGNVRIHPYFSTYSGSVLIAYSAGYAGYGPFSIDANRIQLWTSGSERMRVTSTGDVGIGTSSPTAKLDVNGQLNVPDQLAYDFTTSVLPDIAPTLNLNFVGANAVDPRITFTRSTTATYYDAETTALAEQNLVLYSQEFDNAAWTKSNASVSANSTTAPDGTSTADSLIENSSNGFHAATQSYTLSGTMTLSCYVKANTRTFAALRTYDATNSDRYVVFDLSAGTVGATSASTTGTITPAGGGWYRCTMTYTFTSASGSVGLTIQNANSYVTYTGDGVSGIFIWGFQLEQRSVVTAYNVTTASPITNYIPQLMTAAINQPRLDFDPTTRAPKGFLIEEARTNLFTYSEQFDNAAWTKQASSTVTANTTVAPDGTVTADTVTNGNGQSSSGIYQAATLTNGTAFTISYFVKAGTTSSVVFGAFTGGSVMAATAQIISGPGSISGTSLITLSGLSSTEWTRVRYTVTGAGVSTPMYLYPETTSGATGKSVIVWGAQVEAGSFASSYIPTVATAVARGVDVASMTGTNFSSWYRPDEGTFAFEVMAAAGLRGGSQGLFSVNDGTTSNVMNAARTNTRVMRFNGTGTPAGDISSVGTVADSANSKVIFAYKLNDWGLSLNGAATVTDTSAAVPAVTRFGIGSLDGLFDGSAQWGGHIRSVRFYPTRLSNATLQALTA